jgi:hypothetical protein
LQSLKKAALLEQKVSELKKAAVKPRDAKEIIKAIVDLDANDIAPSNIPYWKKVEAGDCAMFYPMHFILMYL